MSKSIALAVITLNEERNIARCIDSVADLVDEILIYDSGSEDQTEAICQKYKNLKFIKGPWLGYGKTKNHLYSHAQSDYILCLDADEALSPELLSELKALKFSLNGAYEMNRLTNYCGQWIYHSEWFPDYQVRLFPKNKGEWSEAAVHETMQLQSGVTLNKLKGLAHHYSYYNFKEHVERINRYSELGSSEVLKKGKRVTLASAYGHGFFRFIRIFLLKRGFLDGAMGFNIALISGFAVYLKYAKAWQKQRS